VVLKKSVPAEGAVLTTLLVLQRRMFSFPPKLQSETTTCRPLVTTCSLFFYIYLPQLVGVSLQSEEMKCDNIESRPM